MIDNTNRASIVLLLGSTGSGKSAAVRVRLARARPARLMVFDPGQDFGEFGAVTDDLREVARLVLAAAPDSPLAVVFRPSFNEAEAREAFGKFCNLALAAGNVTVIADELEDVMTASWAPEGWRRLVRLGRKRGCRVIAMSQDPAGIEKRVWRMATVVRAGRLNDEDGSAARLARLLLVTPAEIVTLPALAYLERSLEPPVLRRGRIEWRAGKPLEVVESEKKLAPALGAE